MSGDTDGSNYDSSPAEPSGSPDARWLTPGVGAIGAASFFSDAGHEVTTSVLPSFLTTTLGASAGALGVIEGVSDALTGVMKLIGGPMANDPAKRGRIASGGYLGTAIATGAIGAATTVWQAGALRALAWLSRGLRSPARDSLFWPRWRRGRPTVGPSAWERAGDNLGAVVGPLMAAGLVVWLGIRPTMYLAAIPGLFAAVAITIAAREARKRIKTAPPGSARRLDLGELRRARMSQIADRIGPGALLLCNESFASTNEREGSEIARQVVLAATESGVKVLFVTHLYDPAHGLYGGRGDTQQFLRAERWPDGQRTFRMVVGEPLPTSYGADSYRRVFAAS